MQLQCVNCHEPVAAYIAADLWRPSISLGHCESCHPLFDKRIPTRPASTDPATVDEFVVRKYTEYIAMHPEEVHERAILNQDLPEACSSGSREREAVGAAQRVDGAERLLWQKSCKECHAVTFPVPGDFGRRFPKPPSRRAG